MMNKISFFLTVTFLFVGCSDNRPGDLLLKVSDNRRYLEYNNGKPFIYLGCTAWELFHKLNREEATEYLKNRADKGFTVIQAVVLAELDGLHTPNAYGEIPLINSDPAQPNEKYFEHVDFIVNKAMELGLFIGMLPTWGNKVNEGVFNPQNAEVYGEFLGKRYREKPIIWILGGDRIVSNDTVFQTWKAMAQGLRKGDGENHLITFHPYGGQNSSTWFHNEDWLDFNIYQSGHGQRFNKVYEFAEHDYMLKPVKPFVDGEPAYEDIPIRFWELLDWSDSLKVPPNVLDPDGLIRDQSYFRYGFFTGYDIRVHAYWGLLSGSAGYTYGNNAIWQMFDKGDPVVIPCLYNWHESLERPGSGFITHIRKLFESRSFSMLVPDQSAIYGMNPEDSTHIRAAVASDNSFLVAYMAVGQPVRMVMKKISGQKVRAWWYDPRNGTVTGAGEYENKGFTTFTPPTSGIDNDWVLVLDDESKNLPPL